MNKKTKSIKISKKKKQKLEKLGLTQLLEDLKKHGHSTINTLDELIKKPPIMVCIRILESGVLTMNSQKILLKKNKEYVTSTAVLDYNIKYKPSSKPFYKRFIRYRGESLENKKLLVWRFGGIGDLMFAQPLIKYLKSKYPTCHITFATAPHNKEIFKFWPKNLVDSVENMPFSAELLDNTDYHLTFEGSIERCKEAHSRSAIDMFKDVANLDFDPNDYHTEIIPNTELLTDMNFFIPDNTIAFQPRASSVLRTFNEIKIIELINMLTDMNFNVGILDSSKISDNIDKFIFQKRFFKHPNKVLNLAKYSLSLQHCVAILQRCVGSIATDSSITHLSSALKKPTVGVYGPFRGELRMNYYKTGSWVNASKDCQCSLCPCYFHDSDIHKCPYIQNKKEIECMRTINIDDVVREFVDIYEKCVEKK